MNKSILRPSRRRVSMTLAACTFASMAFLSSCATKFTTEPDPARPATNSVGVDEFFTPLPNGEADDYYLLNSGEDDIEYSYFLDEQDYRNARDYDEDSPGEKKYYFFIKDKVKGGHGYGDYNHIHEHIPGPHHYRVGYVGVRETDWTDSLALTDTEKTRIDTAFKAFHACADAEIDSFKVEMKPYRDEFRTRRLAIVAELDSGTVTRDSARLMLDSAIMKYEAETDLLRQGINTELKGCRTDLDLAIKAILTPVQYDIWYRNRGW